ncbi:fungal-specific transcription factor domain-containing protein [Aspergillus karnatakaensis]|uniref:Zn(II)2Cys6 transcription factor n=1 Tax=Aspergillus karnatakaensis TaxID=1810916 RepID=UPI003CCCFD86
MPPRRVTKTKTFAGCWTCRRRKVKCDNYRPRCRRCGETCEGYDVDLYWMDEDSERPCAVKRKAMLIQDPHLPARIDLDEIDRMLDELEEIVDGVGAGTAGAFSAFTVDRAQEEYTINYPSEADDTQADSLLQMDHAVVLTEGLSMYVNSATAELMHHYVHVVADLLQPAHHTHNPYRSLYVPKAIEAVAAGLFVGATGTPSQAGTALFHALLAVSAFHMHRHRPGQPRYCRLGRIHRLKAIEGLQRSLGELEMVADSHTTMSAMLSMASIDLMEGSMTDFWIHLDGCQKLQSILQIDKGETLGSSRTGQLLTISAFMSTLSRSTDPYLPPKPWTDEASFDHLLETSPFNTDTHNLEFTYGITATLARYMDITIILSQHLAHHNTHHPTLSLPTSLEQTIATLHEALTSWSMTDEPLASVQEGDHETLSLVTCHILAFHASLVIYFYTRTAWLSSQNRYTNPYIHPPRDTLLLLRRLHHYNRICVTNLLAAEALKSSCGTEVGWKAMAPIVWPGFIAACEAEPSERPLWRTWWVGVQRYCIGSIAILWDIVQEVWEEGRGEEASPRWMAVLARSGRRVMSGG